MASGQGHGQTCRGPRAEGRGLSGAPGTVPAHWQPRVLWCVLVTTEGRPSCRHVTAWKCRPETSELSSHCPTQGNGADVIHQLKADSSVPIYNTNAAQVYHQEAHSGFCTLPSEGEQHGSR